MANMPEITILGQRVPLRVNDPDHEAIREVIDLVSDRIRAAETRVRKNAAPHQVALLALLDLAEQYVAAKKKTGNFKARMGEKSRRLIQLLEAELRANRTEALAPAASLPRELDTSFDLDEEPLVDTGAK